MYRGFAGLRSCGASALLVVRDCCCLPRLDSPGTVEHESALAVRLGKLSAMDVVRFLLKPEPGMPYPEIRIAVNGRNLADIVG